MTNAPRRGARAEESQLKVQHSCGDPARDGRVLHAIAVKRFPT